MNKNFFTLLVLLSCSQILSAQTGADSTQQLMSDTLKNVTDSVRVEQTVPSKNIPPDLSDFKKFKVNEKTNCLYHVKPIIDVPIAILGIAGTIAGFSLISQKPNTDPNEILNLDPEEDLIGINQKVIHNFDEKAASFSDVFLYGGFVYGFVLLADRDIRHDALKVGLLYLQTMSITGTSYSMTAASVKKLRPYAYNTDSNIVDGQKVAEVSMDKKTNYNATNSFYGGHPSVPAASALFVASVYSTYHPKSAFRFVLYGIAVAATGTCAYLRYQGGMHFPTDLAIGVGLGTTYGLLVPYLHRCKDGSGFSIAPMTGEGKGLHLSYVF